MKHNHNQLTKYGFRNTKAIKALIVGTSGLALLALSLGPALGGIANAEDCVPTAPEVTYTAPAIQTGSAGSTLQYSVNLKNVDAASCLASNINISHNTLPSGWTISYDASVTSLLPGESKDYTVDVTSSTSSTDGRYHIPFWGVKVYSVFMPEDPFAQLANFNLVYDLTDGAPVDTEAPVVSVTSPANGSQVLKGSTTYIVASATDNVAVTNLAFYVNGELLCYGTDAACAWQVPNKKGKRTYNIEVRAQDAAGNTSSAFSTVTAI